MGFFDQVRDWITKAGAGGPGGSVGGSVPLEPGKGVSSFHLWWDGMTPGHYVSCSATLEILQAPAVQKLYFWALQATFENAAHKEFGGAHTGLQWNPSYPNTHAVNWGGYDASGSVEAVLKGSVSELPSRPNDVNTRDYDWQVGVPYRFEIIHTPAGWLGTVTNESTGMRSNIRTLHAGGDRLTGFTCWSEVFAGCTDPSALIRWSHLSATMADGRVVKPNGVRLTFPSGGDCPNTDTVLDTGLSGAVLQRTNTARTSRDGQTLRFG
jgi:hypothetical protein